MHSHPPLFQTLRNPKTATPPLRRPYARNLPSPNPESLIPKQNKELQRAKEALEEQLNHTRTSAAAHSVWPTFP